MRPHRRKVPLRHLLQNAWNRREQRPPHFRAGLASIHLQRLVHSPNHLAHHPHQQEADPIGLGPLQTLASTMGPRRDLAHLAFHATAHRPPHRARPTRSPSRCDYQWSRQRYHESEGPRHAHIEFAVLPFRTTFPPPASAHLVAPSVLNHMPVLCCWVLGSPRTPLTRSPAQPRSSRARP